MPSAARTPGSAAKLWWRGDERLRTEAGGAELGLGARQLHRVDVEADEAPARLQALEDCPRMAAAAEGAIDGGLAGPRPQALQHLGHHDRAMAAGRCLAGVDDLLHLGGIPLRRQLLVLLLEHAGMRAPVTRPTGAAGRRVS